MQIKFLAIFLVVVQILLVGCATSARPYYSGSDLTKVKSEPRPNNIKQLTPVSKKVTTDSRYYIVRKGDTAYSISFQYNIEFQLFVKINKLVEPYILHVGDKLLIKANDSDFVFYRVKPKDTVYSLSKRFGIEINSFKKMNNIDRNNSINVGQLLIVGVKGDKFPQNQTPTKVVVSNQPLPKLETTPTNNVKVSSSNAPALIAVGTKVTNPTISPNTKLTSGTNIKINPNLNTNNKTNTNSKNQNITVDKTKVNTSAQANNQKITNQDKTNVKPKNNEQKVANNNSKTTTNNKTKNNNVASTNTTKKISNANIKWQWPYKGKIIENFSSSEHGNKGIDISGSRGDQIKSAAEGKIVYAGNALRGYGNLIIIYHNDDFLSAYAHNDDILVKEGEHVKKGQVIARMGDTDARSVRLHFEIRYRGESVNPTKYLPKK